ncbi:MAG: GTP cyclohydrolase I FolE [bacterium JZ-2024 1]
MTEDARQRLLEPFEPLAEQMIRILGDDPRREGLRKTPQRMARLWAELSEGYRLNPEEIVNNAVFEADHYSEVILVRDIEYFSLCEHHLLPFFGKAHIGYIPRRKIIGLSKIPRLVEFFSRRLQVQERLTQQVAEFLHATLDPCGVGVVIEGYHLCVAMRGAKKVNPRMVTSTMLGVFREDPRSRLELMTLISKPSSV